MIRRGIGRLVVVKFEEGEVLRGGGGFGAHLPMRAMSFVQTTGTEMLYSIACSDCRRWGLGSTTINSPKSNL